MTKKTIKALNELNWAIVDHRERESVCFSIEIEFETEEIVAVVMLVIGWKIVRQEGDIYRRGIFKVGFRFLKRLKLNDRVEFFFIWKKKLKIKI